MPDAPQSGQIVVNLAPYEAEHRRLRNERIVLDAINALFDEERMIEGADSAGLSIATESAGRGSLWWRFAVTPRVPSPEPIDLIPVKAAASRGKPRHSWVLRYGVKETLHPPPPPPPHKHADLLVQRLLRALQDGGMISPRSVGPVKAIGTIEILGERSKLGGGALATPPQWSVSDPLLRVRLQALAGALRETKSTLSIASVDTQTTLTSDKIDLMLAYGFRHSLPEREDNDLFLPLRRPAGGYLQVVVNGSVMPVLCNHEEFNRMLAADSARFDGAELQCAVQATDDTGFQLLAEPFHIVIVYSYRLFGAHEWIGVANEGGKGGGGGGRQPNIGGGYTSIQ